MPLPAGTVTFLFTDIEGSTKLWEEYPDAMRLALARHDAALRTAIETNRGHVFKTVGDAFCAAFAQAADAVEAAHVAQQYLRALQPSAVAAVAGLSLKVRIAMHTGAAEERDGDYFGPPLNRVARLLEAAHGGQVLLSLATQELARDDLPTRASLRDLGLHRLRDLARPERIFQLLAPDLPDDFPPLKTLDSRPNNLPAQTTPFIGREKEVAAAQDLLRRPDVRLLTFTGSAGTGKTRLGLQVAAELLDAFADGVFFVALAPIRDPALAASTIAQMLEVRETGDRPLLERLKEYLHEKQLLLLLDNFEHVLPAAPLVADLLEASPQLRVLVTSRAVLHLRGEQEFTVPPLGLPDRKRLPPIDRLSQYEAVRLFIERAQSVRADFAITNENAPAVAAICHRLDGLPLAIELAAARSKLLPPQAMLGRLESRLNLLTGGARDLPARQQTLRGAIAWSYDLLESDEMVLFRRLSIFVGGCTLEAAEAVCAGMRDEERGMRNEAGEVLPPLIPHSSFLNPDDVLNGIASLADKSLVRRDETADGAVRLSMLETIREYGQEQLEACEEAEWARAQHARFFLSLAEQHVREKQQGWLDRLEREHDNFRAALDWYGTGAARGAAELTEEAFRLGTAVWRFWHLRGRWTEGRERLKKLQALPGASLQARAMLLRRAGQLAWLQGEYTAARSSLEESLALCRQVGDPTKLPAPLNALGDVARTQGDYETARALFEESLALLRARDYKAGMAWSLHALGEVAQEQGDLAARALMEESLALFREVGDRLGISCSLSHLGEAARIQGDLGAARALNEESLAMERDVGHKGGIARSLSYLGNVALHQQNYDEARALYQECLALRRELGDKRSIAACLERLAGLAVRSGGRFQVPGEGASERGPAEGGAEAVSLCPTSAVCFERAARLFGAAAALREALGAPLPPADRSDYDRCVEAVRVGLGEGAFAAAWAAGRSLPLEQAIADAMAG